MVAFPVGPSGTRKPRDLREADTTRASEGAGCDAELTVTRGGPSIETGNPSPRMTTRLPGTAQPGSIAVMTGTGLVVVEFDVPVDVIAPAFGRVPEAEGNADGRRLVRTPRMANEPHAGLLRRSAALAAVAAHTTGDDVFPVLAPGLRHGDDVIEGQLGRWERVTAVLAGVLVARVDVRPRKRHVLRRSPHPDAA